MNIRTRKTIINAMFTTLCWAAACVAMLLLGVLLVSIVSKGLHYLRPDFLTNPPSRKPDKAGLGPAIWGSVFICSVCAFFAIPIGVGTAVLLEEYQPRNRLLGKLHKLLQLNITNLAGVPSIVYGILGLTLFVQCFGLFGNPNNPAIQFGATYYDQFVDEAGQYLEIKVPSKNAPTATIAEGTIAYDGSHQPVTIHIVSQDELDAIYDTIDKRLDQLDPDMDDSAFDEAQQDIEHTLLAGVITDPDDLDIERIFIPKWYYFQIPLGRSVFAGGLTLMLVILPIIIIASQEAIRAVPSSLRHCAHGLGATKWQVTSRVVLPAAVPGIMTGSILAMSRAIGEAAPMLVIAGIVYITFTPQHLMDEFTAMPLQIYDWAGRPQEAFHHVASTGIIVLLTILLSFNAIATLVRHRFEKKF